MKILHISRTMGQGGAEKIVYQLCKNKDQNTKFVASAGGFYVDKLNENDVKHFKIPDINSKNPFLMIKTFLILMRIIKKEQIEIIHSHHRMAAFYSQFIRFFHRKLKLVYTAHNVFEDKKRLTSFSLKNTNIIACGNGVKNNLIDFFNIDKKNITVICNAVEISLKNSKNQLLDKLNKSDAFLIGFIGRLSEQKGVDIFIKGLKNIIDNNKKVYGIIVGDGELRKDIEQLSCDLNIANNIVFLGFQENVFDIINQFKFAVLPSRWEGFPLTPIEVFSMSKTIIATNIPGNNEIVNESNGLLFEKDNIDELSAKMQYLIENSNVRKKLEMKAYIDYKNLYSYETFIKNYNNIYEKLEVL